MDFIANQRVQIDEMLQDLGIPSIETLWKNIPQDLILKAPPFDDGLSEMEGFEKIKAIARQNRAHEYQCYLGAGAYDHYVPALVSAITAKSEFLTAYTPYQPETSQGMLQVIFEFQTAIARLTGLDIANASMYDGASACAESLRMAQHFNGRRKVVVPATLNPNYRAVIDLYLKDDVVEIPEGADFKSFLKEDVAAILLPYPNYYGIVEDYKPLIMQAKQKGVLTVMQVNPLALALYQSPGELQADIAAGDGQPLGLPLNFGGPYVGFIACRKELIRSLPGRIVGLTKDRRGNEGFVLTLQAREQHIRREKATSNICTNQALQSLAMLITILWYGREGLKKLALTNYQRANYLKTKLEALPQVIPFSSAPIFNEFVVGFKEPVLEKFYQQKILPGVPLPGNRLLVAVTETKSKADLDRYIAVLK